MNGVAIGVYNRRQVTVVKFPPVVLFVFQGDGRTAYRQGKSQAVLVLIGRAAGNLEIVLAAVRVLIHIIV